MESSPGFFEEAKQKASLAAAERNQDEADKKRPKRKELCRDAYPSLSSHPKGEPCFTPLPEHSRLAS